MRNGVVFPSLKDGIKIFLRPLGDSWIILEKKELYSDAHTLSISRGGYLPANRKATDILLRCNGSRSLEEISSETRSSNEIVLEFLKERSDLVSFNNVRSPKALQITGSREFYIPLHLVVELTYRCNLKCLHCYAADRPLRDINTHQLLNLLDEFSRLGTKSIEFTGGEPTLHPEFESIFLHALNRFELVAFITNGTLLRKEFINTLSNFKERIVIQTSLHSSTPYWHDRFTQVKGSWEKTLQCIKALAENKIPTRVVSMLTPQNIHDIENVASLCHGIGVKWYTFSFPSEMGRGEAHKEIFFSYENREQLDKLVEKSKCLMEKFGDFIYKIDTLNPDPFKQAYGNCGTGTKVMTLSPVGEIRPCVVLPSEYVSFGNAFEDGLEAVLKNQMIGLFSRLPAPSEEECGKCQNLYFCKECIVRGIYRYNDLKERCRWGKRWLGELYDRV